MSGPIALVGGAEFTPAAAACDRTLLALSGAERVLVLPTAAAFEHPDRAVANAERWFAGLGVEAVGLDVLTRRDALDPAKASAVRESAFTYLTGGSPMHLRSVLKDSPVWEALVAANAAGGLVAGSSAGAMVLTDPMVDPRGGAFTLGLGLVARVAVVPHAEHWSADRLRRTLDLGAGIPVVTLESGAAVVRAADGTWHSHGRASVYLHGALAGLSVLPPS